MIACVRHGPLLSIRCPLTLAIWPAGMATSRNSRLLFFLFRLLFYPPFMTVDNQPRRYTLARERRPGRITVLRGRPVSLGAWSPTTRLKSTPVFFLSGFILSFAFTCYSFLLRTNA
jgi:hypothetical protein